MQKRKWSFLTGIVLLILLAGLYAFFKVSKPHKSVAANKAASHISAEKLYADYTADENKANQDYLNKTIEVKGKITGIARQSAQYVIMLQATASGGINCLMMDDAQKLSALKTNDDITIKGKCAGFLMDVNLVDCVLIK